MLWWSSAEQVDMTQDERFSKNDWSLYFFAKRPNSGQGFAYFFFGSTQFFFLRLIQIFVAIQQKLAAKKYSKIDDAFCF